MRRMRSRRIIHLVLASTLVLGIAACGGDDDDGGGSASPANDDADATDESAAFCDALVAAQDALFSVEVSEDDPSDEEMQAAFETLDPAWADVEEVAPAQHEETVEALGDAIDDLGDGDATAYNDDATSSQYFGMVADTLESCDLETAEVTALDYAFAGVPETLPAGRSGLVLVNETENDERHEFIIFKKADGDTRSAEEILNDPAAQEEGPGEFAGAVFAVPGGTAGSFLDLAPGDYIAVCFIPVGGGEDGPPHFTEGMFAEFSAA